MADHDEHHEHDGRTDDGGGAPGRDGAAPKRLPGWSKALLAVSIVLMVAGLALRGYAFFTEGDQAAPRPVEQSPAIPAPAGPDGLVQGLQPTQGQGGEGGQSGDPGPDGTERGSESAGEDALDVWSPVVFRLGFSFFAGFVIAYAVRTFMKISFIVAGLVILGVFGLDYSGLVDVKWDAISGYFDVFTGWLGEQTNSFRSFVTGRLPSTAAAAAGLFAGFRKK